VRVANHYSLSIIKKEEKDFMKNDYSALASMLAKMEDDGKEDNTITDEILGYIREYKPFVIEVAKEAFDLYKKWVDNEELHQYSAKELMNNYQAYIAAGFTEEQAFILLLNKRIEKDELSRRLSVSSKNK
jgi:hypothetical protein